MHVPEAQAKGDISILLTRGHFYFALTRVGRKFDTRDNGLVDFGRSRLLEEPYHVKPVKSEPAHRYRTGPPAHRAESDFHPRHARPPAADLFWTRKGH